MIILIKHLRHYLSFCLKMTVLFVFVMLLLLNIYLSQFVSPLYYQLVTGNKNAVIAFLAKIKNTPYFPAYFAINSHIFGENIEQAVFSAERKRKLEIKKFESILNYNSKSRDILYNLSLLYREDDNLPKAKEYLRKAKEIDPSINNFQFPITNFQ